MDARALKDAVADKLIAHDKESGFPCPSYNCTADIAVDAVLEALEAEGIVLCKNEQVGWYTPGMVDGANIGALIDGPMNDGDVPVFIPVEEK